jgi:glycosyltransferase involved in cell wall biosynthesis
LAFSVIVPVYNAKEYLRECIESVLNQTYADFELVLVDDGSKDGSGEICDEYAGKDTRVKVFHEPNMGQLHSREYGIARSSNEWLLFLDADDYLEKTALEVISGKIGRYACDCVVFGFRKFKGDQTLAVVTEDRKEYPTDSTRELFRTLLFEPVYNAIWRKAVNKSCFDSRDYSGFYHLRLAEDRLQSAEIFSNAKKVLFIDDVLYNYRVNEAGITRNPSLDMLSSLAAEEEILRIIRQKAFFHRMI